MEATVVFPRFLVSLVVFSPTPLVLGSQSNNSCPNNCNNHGSCDQPNQSHSTWWCNCSQGWNGASCGKHLFFFSFFSFFFCLKSPSVGQTSKLVRTTATTAGFARNQTNPTLPGGVTVIRDGMGRTVVHNPLLFSFFFFLH